MSRTIRRKNAWDFYAYDFEWDDELGGCRRVWHAPNSREYKLAKSKYHRDNRTYSNSSVPHWFTNLYWERGFRQQSREAIHNWCKNPENTEMMAPVFKRSIGWYYW